MPISALDPNTALVVIDLQQGTTAYPSAHPITNVITNAVALAAAFRGNGLPVVLVRFDPSQTPAGRTELGGPRGPVPPEFMEFVPELAPQTGDIVVTKGAWSALAGTDLADTLARRGVTQLVLAGVATSFGVESTARQAYDAGFNVTIAVDAITDPRAESHEHSVNGVFRVLGEAATTDEILALLTGP